MKTPKGWKKISNQRGFLNETTGQILVVAKKEFGEHFYVLLFNGVRTENSEGKTISPIFPTEAKAEAYAIRWMTKNPNGQPDPV